MVPVTADPSVGPRGKGQTANAPPPIHMALPAACLQDKQAKLVDKDTSAKKDKGRQSSDSLSALDITLHISLD
ncbi:hypothetical protein VZT92_000171 [Zoarces viviparus]|uniref:Uncharacterized protein n=1 Tax=Zoarces viviparus TaxID=48416 RepID=A0AAW1G601_ZOAVI